MKTALITTTINVPRVLSLYRAHDPDVMFFVAADLKTSAETYDFCNDMENCVYLSPHEQDGKYHKLSKAIGWGTVRRRNIAVLEALRWGADIIVTIDTDNFPLAPSFFSDIRELVSCPYTGIELTAESGWVDPGWLIHPPVAHRGIPIRLSQFHTTTTHNQNIGVVACTVLGSCDLAAVDRLAATLIEGQPKRHVAAELARSGAIVNPAKHRTIFNTQATAFTRQIAPAIFCAPAIGRHDDICASVIMQRLMKEFNLQVHVGRPIVWHEHQDRSEKVIVQNVEEELWGFNNFEAFSDAVFDTNICGRTPLDALAFLWAKLGTYKFMPAEASEAALLFIEEARNVV